MALVERSDLVALLQRDVAERTADTAVRLAVADLRPLVRSRDWPSTREQCEDLWSATLRLAVLYVDNPLMMRSSTSGGVTDEWSVSGRAEIRAEVASRYGAVAPSGSFPPAQAWPDPAERRAAW